MILGGHGDGRRESPPAVPLFRGRARPVSQLAGPGAGPASASCLIAARVSAMPR